LIINWDAANGDYITGSDDVFMYFMTRKDRRDACLRNGGTILCEYQTGRGELHQGAYDAIFGGGELQVVDAHMPTQVTEEENYEEDQWNYSSVSVSKEFRKIHPIIANLPERIASKHDLQSKVELFNFNPKRPQSSFYAYKYRGSLYNCWFSRWERDWVPLLVADLRYPWPWWRRMLNPTPAVLLAKVSGGGLMLASTLWIAGSKAEELVNSIVDLKMDQIQTAHKIISRRRAISDSIVGVVLAALSGFLILLSPWLRRVFLEQLGFVWGGLILLRFWRHLIWKRSFGLGVLQYAKYGWKTFWDTL